MPRKSNGSSAGGGSGKHEKDSALPTWLDDIAIVNWEAAEYGEFWEELHREIWLSDDRLWSDPGIPEVLLSLWKDFRDLFRDRCKVLEDIQWSEVDSSKLVALYAWNHYMRGGALILQTESRSDETAKERQELARNERNPFKTWRFWLLFETLLRKGFKDYLITRQREDGLCPAITNFVWGYVGPSVEKEIMGRAEKHWGFEAFLLYCGAEFGDDLMAEWSLKQLRKYVGNIRVRGEKFRQTMIPALVNRDFKFKAKGTNPEESYKINKQQYVDAWQHVDGQAFETVKEFCRKHHHYELLRMAIDGKLNIIPRKIVDDVVDYMRQQHQQREKHVVLFQEFNPDEQKDPLSLKLEEGLDHVAPRERGELIDSVDDGEGKELIYGDEKELIKKAKTERKQEKWETFFMSLEPRIDEQVIQNDELEKLSRGDPRKKKFLLELTEGRTKRQIAEDLDLSCNTPTNWLRAIRDRWKQLNES